MSLNSLRIQSILCYGLLRFARGNVSALNERLESTGSVPSLKLRVHTRVKDTFVLHVGLCGFDDDYVTSSHGNQCSWPPTRSHGAKPTRPAGQLRSPLRTRLLPLSLSSMISLSLTWSTHSFPLPLSLFTSTSYLSTLFREDYSRGCNNVFTRRTCRVIPTVLPR